MNKIFPIIAMMACFFAGSKLNAQCSVNISTNPNTTQLNCTNNSITLTANAEGGIPDSYLWSTGEKSKSINVSEPKTYEVTININNLCNIKTSITITRDIAKPTVSILAFPEKICAGESATLVALGAKSYVWEPPVNPASEVITVSPSKTETYKVTGTGVNGCTASAEYELVVNKLPTATIAGSIAICQNAAQPAITFRGQTGTKPYTFFYNIGGGAIQTIQTTGPNDAATIGAPTGALGDLSYNLVSVMDANGCTQQQTGTATISVLAGPVLTSPKTASVCDNALFQYTAVSSANPATFSWTRPAVNGISNAEGTGSGNVISETLNNTTLKPVEVEYIFSLSTGTGCVTTDILKVMVNPTPVTNAIPNKTYCNGEFVSAGIPFTSNSPGAAFSWTNSNSSIGLSSSGSGSIPPFIATNSSSDPLTATITVFVKAGTDSCEGASRTFTITIRPAPDLISPKNTSTCDRSLFSYTASSSASATLFSWQRPVVAGISNLAESANSRVINETLINSTDQPVIVPYIFTLSTGAACVSTDTLKVTVNPTPVIDEISDTTFCNAFFVSTGIPFNSSSPGTSFRWTNSNTRIGLPASGRGSIPPFNATNTGNGNISSTITVFIKSSADSCEGLSRTFTITVRPAPVFTGLKVSSVCDDSLFAYRATSSVSSTTFSWVRDTVNGISNPKGSGSAAIISETLYNTTDTPIVVRYVYSLTTPGSSCSTSETLEVTVNPSPVINIVENRSYCNGEFVSGGIRFSSSSPNAVFRWINDNPNIGLTTSGNGDILPFNATNNSTGPIEANITVFVKASTDSCEGASRKFTITILPGPLLTSSKLVNICTDTAFNYTITSPAAGTLYSWKRLALPAGVTGEPLPDVVNTSLIRDILHNNNNEMDTVNYEVNLSIDGNSGCKSVDTIDVLVFPTPRINSINDTIFCNNTLVTAGIPFTSPTSSAAFTWKNSNTNIGLSSGGSGGITPFIVTNRTMDSIGANVNVSVTVNNGQCPGPDENFRIIVYPTPAMISAGNSSFCNDSLFQYAAESSAFNTAFKWTRPRVDNIIPETGSGSTADIRERLSNGTSNPIPVKYLFAMETGQLAVMADRTGCTTIDSVWVTVNPTPVIDSIRDTTFCNKVPVRNGISFESPTPNKAFTWTNSNTRIGLPASGTGNIPSFIATNTDTVPITATITVNIKASSDSCMGASREFNITVNPSAARPNFYSLSDIEDSSILTLCAGSNNINFNVQSISPRTSYVWELDSGNTSNVSIRDRNDPSTVISFVGSGQYRIRTIATNFAHGGCKDTVVQRVTVNGNPGIEERKVFLKQPGNLLIYPDNSLTKYQWGINSVLAVSPDSSFGPPISVSSDVYQFYPAGSNFDTTRYLYWVLLENAAGCKSRVYFNGPYAAKQSEVVSTYQPVEMLVFPNPNQGNFDVSLKGNIYGNIQAKIYNALGQQVFTKKFVKNAPEVYEKFNAGKLNSGIYFLELNSSDLKKVVTRFIIQH